MKHWLTFTSISHQSNEIEFFEMIKINVSIEILKKIHET